MADPLSIVASIVGLIAAAGKVCGVLSSFIGSTVDAPESAASTLQNMEHMKLTLYSVQSLIESLDSIEASRKSLIQLDHLSIVVTHSVLTVSELESIICHKDGIMHRLRWVWNEKKVLGLLPRLETQKSSLTLMVAVLQSKSQADAQSNHQTLLGRMDDVVQQNEILAQRLERLEGALVSDNRSVKFLDDASSILSRRLSSISFKRGSTSSKRDSLLSISQKRASIAISNPSIIKSEFEEELEQSRVYSRTQQNEPDMSFTSSNAPSNAWSMLSGMSLNDISVISAFRLPITVDDIDLLAPGSTFSLLLADTPAETATAIVEMSTAEDRGPQEGIVTLACFSIGELPGKSNNQEPYEGLRLSTYPGTRIFLVLSQRSNMDGYQNVEEKWIPEIIQTCPDAPYLLVPTYRSQSTRDNAIPEYTTLGKQVAERTGAVAYVECDVDDPVAARAVFNRPWGLVSHLEG
ncbi:hypothetical protein F66182_9004 [Fusarium sp. NRRL 66182]|nr:hypothetical protein F66182_9004 [Fusarium sp. NRRL 66182]